MSHPPLLSDAKHSLEEGEIHDILRNDRRRKIIEHLRDSNQTVAVSDLSEHIASLETDKAPAPRNVRKSVYVSLHQTHLPKLDDWGVIDYDYRSKEVTLLDRAEQVAVYMEVVPQGHISWGLYYFGLGVLALVTLAATRLDIILLSSLGMEFWSWFYAILLTLSAGYQVWDARNYRISL